MRAIFIAIPFGARTKESGVAELEGGPVKEGKQKTEVRMVVGSDVDFSRLASITFLLGHRSV
jgi:hypothetical protein